MVENSNPQIFEKSGDRLVNAEDEDEDVCDEIDNREIFDAIKGIRDPEHELSLEELNVVHLDRVSIDSNDHNVLVQFSPTVPHCSMATLIGLSLKVQLLRVLPPRFKVAVLVTPGTHASELAVNKQLNDKERVAAALENNALMEVINLCIAYTYLARSRAAIPFTKS